MLPSISKTKLAERLGVSRWTLDRDLAALDQVAEHLRSIVSSDVFDVET